MKLQFREKICPKGPQKASFLHAKPPKEPARRLCKEQIQLTFIVSTDEDEFVAYRKFCADLSTGSELHVFLRGWLGEEFSEYLDKEGNFDFDCLKNKGVDLVIGHHEDGLHAGPFIQILAIFPRGTVTGDADLVGG